MSEGESAGALTLAFNERKRRAQIAVAIEKLLATEEELRRQTSELYGEHFLPASYGL